VQEPQYVNEQEVFILLNPAPFVQPDKLKEAEEAGQPVLHHRQNTPWYLCVPALGVTIPVEVEEGPVVGFQPYKKLFRIADDLISQLKSLSSKELAELQGVRHDFVDWPPESRVGQVYNTVELKNS
jgi:hypothetical protein